MNSPHTLFDDSRAPWLFLSLLPGLDSRRWSLLCEPLESPLQLFDKSTATLRAMGLTLPACEALDAWRQRRLAHPKLRELQVLLGTCDRGGIELVSWGDSLYPEGLRHIHDPPLVLYVRGNASLLCQPQIGIVGSRKATRSALNHAGTFAAGLSRAGYLVTSGLALGVDGAAHRGALEAGYATLAVIGCGVDVVYPRAHRQLTQQIIAGGAVISDLPPGTPPKAPHFPQRNRLISGLSQGVLVVEASLRSGSLITARLALEQGRDVFAIPGSIDNPQARGCHRLIRDGAVLVESPENVADELNGWWSPPARVPAQPVAKPVPATPVDMPVAAVCEAPANDLPDHLEPREIAVIEALGYDPVSTDTLCSATGLAAPDLLQSLLLLELEGLVEAAPGGYLRISG